jgi:hypothetical protein
MYIYIFLILLHVALTNLVFDIVFHSEQYFWQKKKRAVSGALLFMKVLVFWDVTRSISIDGYCTNISERPSVPIFEYSRMSRVALAGNGVA